MSEFEDWVINGLLFQPHEGMQITVVSQEELQQGLFPTKRLSRDKAIAYAEKNLSGGKNVYYGVNPVAPGSGRATAKEVTRQSAFWLDLDFKPTGLGGPENAGKLIEIFSDCFNWPVSAVFHTGFGLHAYWCVEYEENNFHEQKMLVRRLEMYAQELASKAGLGAIDTVSDPTRVMRVPGSVNHKVIDSPPTVYRVGAIHTTPEGITTCLTEEQALTVVRNPFLI